MVGGVLIALITFLNFNADTLDRFEKVRDNYQNGWRYEGQQVITNGQFAELKTIVDRDDVRGTLTVIMPEPLEVKYNFTTSDDLGYLDREKWDGMSVSIISIRPAAAQLVIIIAMLFIVMSLVFLARAYRKPKPGEVEQ